MSSRIQLVFCLLLGPLLLTTGCYEDPDQLETDEIIKISVTPAEGVKADGQTILEVLVEVKPDTRTTENITISTSRGILNNQAAKDSAEQRTIQRQHPGNGKISAPLRVGIEPGEMLVTATLGGYEVYEIVLLEPVEPLDVTFERHNESRPLVADGSVPGDIIVHHTPSTFAGENATVTVSSGRINFQAAEGQEARTVSQAIPDGANGILRFPLEVGTAPGDIVISAKVGDMQAQMTLNVSAAQYTPSITLAEATELPPADGTSMIEFEVDVSPDLPPGDSLVVSTTSGVLNFQAPEGPEARTRKIHSFPQKLRLKVGTQAGLTVLSAAVGPIQTELAIPLESPKYDITITTTTAGPYYADGTSAVEIDVAVGGSPPNGQDLVLTASAGLWLPTADSSTITIAALTQTQLSRWLELGTQSGQVAITATLGEFSVTKMLVLEPSLATALVLSAPRGKLQANGSDALPLTATVYADGPIQVSKNTRIFFSVCCLDNNLDAQLCPQSVPVQVPDFADVILGQSVTVSLVSAAMNPGGPETPLAVFAGVGAPANACSAGSVGDTLFVQLLPDPEAN